MKRLKTYYKIGNRTYSFNCFAKTFRGKNEVLLDKGDNLLENVDFKEKGYLVANFKKFFSHKSIVKYVTKYVKNVVEKHLNIKIKNFNLENYHKYVDKSSHYEILGKISKGVKFSKIFSRRKIEKFVSQTLKVDVTTRNKKYTKKINPNVFLLRIIRPSKSDFNPPHRDVYFDRYKSGVNIYIPICASNKKSSLPIFPHSHKFNESKVERTGLNSNFNNLKFSVPIIVKTFPSLKLVRPNPKNNQLMIFSSYLIHGGGLNENRNKTRVSIELRFWRSK